MNKDKKLMVVTCLYDLGRGKWDGYERPVEEYLIGLSNVLNIKTDITIFTDMDIKEFVKRKRKLSKYRTFYVHLPFKDIYMMKKYGKLLQDIQDDPEYAKDHPKREAPEISRPTYAALMGSKMDFMFRASKVVKDDTYMVWLDAGYTHGYFDIGSVDWYPESIMRGDVRDKVTMILLKDLDGMKSKDPVEFSNSYDAFINGGFIGVSKKGLGKAMEIFHDIIHYQLTELRLKEDDQHYWTFVALEHPEMMNLVKAGWYDALLIR